MEFKKIGKNQGGYLLIIAVIAIVVIGLIASILVSMYVATTRSTVNSLESTTAFYIAKAGLEIATRDLVQPGTTTDCLSVQNKYVNVCYKLHASDSNCTGQFTIDAASHNPGGLELRGGLGVTQTTVTLNSTADLAPSGIVVIGDEAIWYSKISGNNLLNVTRGAFGTPIQQHTTSSIATQDVCVLTATAAVPNLNNPAGKRILQTTLWRDPNIHCLGAFPGCITPAFIGASTVSLGGGTVISNPSVNSPQSTNYKGSTIACGGNLSISGGGFYTYIDNIPTPQSTATNIGKDIYKNNNDIVNTSLWNLFFPGQSMADVRATADTVLSPANGNCNYDGFVNASGVVWVGCPGTSNNPYKINMKNTDVSIGSATNPVTFIIGPGSVPSFTNIKSLSIYGLTYFVNGSKIIIPQGTKVYHYGLRASENNGAGSDGYTKVIFNYSLLNAAKFMSTPYSQYFMTNEVFN